MTNGREFDTAATYQIKIKGELEIHWGGWFDGFEIMVQEGNTLLTGMVMDQSALYGLLGKLNDLGMLLLSVTRQEF